MDEAIVKEILEDIYKEIYIPTAKLPEYIFVWNFTNLITNVDAGYGRLIDFRTGTKKRIIAESFRTNINIFSGAKTYQEVKELSSMLYENGKKVAKDKFINRAIEINELYNSKQGNSYLKVEMDAAYKQSLSARQWANIEEESEVLPLLQYRTAGDGRVRDEHAAWDGLIYPVDHSFWNTHMPPNDWGCRCDVIQLREGKVSSEKRITENSSKLWANNPGKDQFIFDPSEHPYFKNIPREVKKNNFGFGYE